MNNQNETMMSNYAAQLSYSANTNIDPKMRRSCCTHMSWLSASGSRTGSTCVNIEVIRVETDTLLEEFWPGVHKNTRGHSWRDVEVPVGVNVADSGELPSDFDLANSETETEFALTVALNKSPARRVSDLYFWVRWEMLTSGERYSDLRL